jgi:hypothetical protein
MDIQHVPPALQERLGSGATLALVSAISAAGRDWKGDVMIAASDRFERRLAEVAAGLERQLAGMESRLLKWSFAFWMGQIAVMTAIMSALLRAQ